MDILTEIATLHAAYRNANAGDHPRLLLVPWQRAKEFVELARGKRHEGKLIMIPGQRQSEDVGIATILGMHAQLSLGNKLYVGK